MSKKEIAISFLKHAATGEVRTAYEKFVSLNFIHHNQYFKGDRASLLRAMEEAHKASPNKSIDVKQVIEECDKVVAHSVVRRKDESLPLIAVVHIFRFEDNMIAEMWDIGEEVDIHSPNENGPV